MAIAYVQGATARGDWNTDPISLTATLGVTATGGNLLVAVVAWRKDRTVETPTVAGFTKVTDHDSGLYTRSYIFLRLSDGTENSATVSFPTDGTRMILQLAEYSGSFGASLSYTNAEWAGGSDAGGTSRAVSVTSTASGIIFAHLAIRGNNGGVTVGTPFTVRMSSTDMGPNLGEVHAFLAEEIGDAATYTATWSWATETTNQATIVAVYEDAGTSQLDTPVVTVDATTNPSSAIAEDGTADVSWPAITGAGSYRVELASGLNATTGFTVVEESHATTSIQLTGLGEGDRTVGVTAKP